MNICSEQITILKYQFGVWTWAQTIINLRKFTVIKLLFTYGSNWTMRKTPQNNVDKLGILCFHTCFILSEQAIFLLLDWTVLGSLHFFLWPKKILCLKVFLSVMSACVILLVKGSYLQFQYYFDLYS